VIDKPLDHLAKRLRGAPMQAAVGDRTEE